MRTRGVVIVWHKQKGFGFVRTAGGAEFFAHETSLVDPGEPPSAGEAVEFVARSTERGPRAERVRRLPPTCPKCEAPLQGLRCDACGFLLGTI
jgi:cold shock CspA family protein